MHCVNLIDARVWNVLVEGCMVAWRCKVMFIQLALAGQFSLDHRAAYATPTTASGRCLVCQQARLHALPMVPTLTRFIFNLNRSEMLVLWGPMVAGSLEVPQIKSFKTVQGKNYCSTMNVQDDPGCIVDKADDRHAAAMLEAPHSITKKILLYSFKMARYGKMAWFSCRSPIFCCSSCVTFEAVGVESSVIASGTGLFVAKLMRNLAASEVWRYDEIWYDEICMEFVWIWIDM